MDGFPSDNSSNSIGNAARNRDSIALGMVLSIILVHFVQFFLSSFESALDFYPVDIFSVIPVLADDPLHQHRILTSAWLHADFIHVLGNALVIALAGVPLEQRMGGKRWIAIYIIGLVGESSLDHFTSGFSRPCNRGQRCRIWNPGSIYGLLAGRQNRVSVDLLN